MYDNGKYAGCIVYATDEKERSFREEECRELLEISKIIESNINREKYDLASRAKSDFLSRMSHEIRTPMNAIIGMTGIAMQEKQEPDRVEDCLRKIDRSSQYLLSLINDILDMSKIESGKMKLETGCFSLKELAEGVRNLIEPQAQAKGISFVQETHIPQEWVTGQPPPEPGADQSFGKCGKIHSGRRLCHSEDAPGTGRGRQYSYVLLC